MTDYSYRVRIKKETTPALQKLAVNLGFVATKPGKYFGAASPGSLLDALAAAYERDSGAVIDALREIGVVNVYVHTPNPDSDPDIQET